MIADDARASSREWAAACDEAREVLADVPRWSLPEPRWEQARRAMADMTGALAAASLKELWRATGRLQLCSPPRVLTRLGDDPPLPAPKAVRERVAELIYSLDPAVSRSGDAAGTAGEPAQPADTAP
jgi:hypothetical protein